MSLTRIVEGHIKQYPFRLTMDSTIDKDERKREYNRLAQREFRRRRKEHLKSLEQAQKAQSSERAEEIDRLRCQNDELRRENNALRAHIYSNTPSSNQLISTPIFDTRQYSLSPSVSGASVSVTGSPPSMVGSSSEFLPLGNLSMTSSMTGSSLQSYSDQDLSTQPYSLVHYSGIRHNIQSSPESSGYRNCRSSLDTPFHSLRLTGSQASSPTPTSTSMPTSQRHTSGTPAWVASY